MRCHTARIRIQITRALAADNDSERGHSRGHAERAAEGTLLVFVLFLLCITIIREQMLARNAETLSQRIRYGTTVSRIRIWEIETSRAQKQSAVMCVTALVLSDTTNPTAKFAMFHVRVMQSDDEESCPAARALGASAGQRVCRSTFRGIPDMAALRRAVGVSNYCPCSVYAHILDLHPARHE